MATKGREIHALEMKIRTMAEIFCERGKTKTGSKTEFAEKADLDYEALKSAWSAGRVSRELEQKLADQCGFDKNDPTWVDESIDPRVRSTGDNALYPGRDSVNKFRAMLRRQHDLPGTGTDVRMVATLSLTSNLNSANKCGPGPQA